MKANEKPSVALIFGGRGYEHDISIRGAEYVFPLIDGSKYRKIPIYIKRSGAWVTPVLRDITTCPRALIDGAIPTEECAPTYKNHVGGIETDTAFIPLLSVFPLLHGDFGEDGVVQGALENAKIPYVGCSVQTSAVARDKGYVKLAAEHLGIPTAKWMYVSEPPTEETFTSAEERLGYPMFIKPARLGSSVGAGVARNRGELQKSLCSALAFGSGKAVIEEYLNVEKELECGYFEEKGKELFTEIGEISKFDGFYDYETKYLTQKASVSQYADISRRETEEIQVYSSRLAKFLGLKGISRIDFFRTANGSILFNEINTMPGFTESSLYPRLALRSGITPENLVNRLIASVFDG